MSSLSLDYVHLLEPDKQAHQHSIDVKDQSLSDAKLKPHPLMSVPMSRVFGHAR